MLLVVTYYDHHRDLYVKMTYHLFQYGADMLKCHQINATEWLSERTFLGSESNQTLGDGNER